ncbi:MAG: hypothetical protein WCG85_13235 [Polyangia bacterium]
MEPKTGILLVVSPKTEPPKMKLALLKLLAACIAGILLAAGFCIVTGLYP